MSASRGDVSVPSVPGGPLRSNDRPLVNHTEGRPFSFIIVSIMRCHYISHLEGPNVLALECGFDTRGSLKNSARTPTRESHLLEQKGFEK
jgi:hypothetical protein